MTENAEDNSELSVWMWIFIGFMSLGLLGTVAEFVMWKATPGQEATSNPPTAESIARADAVLVEEGDAVTHPLPSAPPPNPPTAEPIARADAVLVEEGDAVAHPLPSAPPPNPPTAEPIARADAVLVEEGDAVAHPLPSAPPMSLVFG